MNETHPATPPPPYQEQPLEAQPSSGPTAFTITTPTLTNTTTNTNPNTNITTHNDEYENENEGQNQNESADPEDTLKILTGMFPHMKPIDLRLLISNNREDSSDISKLIDILLLNEETRELTLKENEQALTADASTVTTSSSSKSFYYSTNTIQLIEMFPDLDINQVERALIETNDDLDASIARLLSEAEELQTPKEETSNDNTNKKNDWNSFDEDLAKLEQLLSVPKQDLSRFFYKNSGQYVPALIDIIKNYKRPQAPKVEADDGSMEVSRPQGGRVQRGGGSGKMRRKPPPPPPPPPKPEPQFEMDKDALQDWVSDISQNSTFKSIDHEFISNTILLVDGDITKILQILETVADSNNSSHAIEFEYDLVPHTPLHTNNKENEKLIDLDPELEGVVTPIFNAFENQFELDLHRLSVPQAKQIVEYELNNWLNHEMVLSENHGRKTRHRSHTTMNVITGRGIHSSEFGKSVLKFSVERYLQNHKFLYDEHLGGFIVKGKKRT